MTDVRSLVWNLRAVILFPFLLSALIFLPSPLALFCLVIFLLMVHSPDFFSRKFSNISG